MIWIESGITIGLVERREEYDESSSRSPAMTLLQTVSTNGNDKNEKST